MKLISISDVSKGMGLSTRTLRYYEEIGLIESIKVDDYAYRMYSEDTIVRLQQIVVLKKLRIPLKEIADIIKNDDTALALSTFEKNIKEIDEEIGSLFTIKNIFKKLIDKLNLTSNLKISEEILSDDYIIDVVDSITADYKENRNLEPNFKDLFIADKTLNKIKDDDVRILYLPPMAVASAYAKGYAPELVTENMVKKFINDTNLKTIYPNARHFGFNNPDEPIIGEGHCYERYISVPCNMEVPMPLVKKHLPGGLYAAYAIKMGEWEKCTLFYDWVINNRKYSFRRGAISGASGMLEEHLNYLNWYRQGLTEEENDKNYSIDLLIPIKEKGKTLKSLINRIAKKKFNFCEFDIINSKKYSKLSNNKKYKMITDWSLNARLTNPDIFEKVCEWILDNNEWSADKIKNNEKIFTQEFLAHFINENILLRYELDELKLSGLVNVSVFDALDKFNNALLGFTEDNEENKLLAKVFSDFDLMQDFDIRKQIAGVKRRLDNGYEICEIYGYIRRLSSLNTAVQWTLFMPDLVKAQQKDFKVDSFEYKILDSLRFIGKENIYIKNEADKKSLFDELNAMSEYNSSFSYDVIFTHHNSKDVNEEDCHKFFGRFMKADAPVPNDFIYFDLISQNDGKSGFPYISQFAFAKFLGDFTAMQSPEGYDYKAIYDVTRNIILGQGVYIPYPEKYWTADVFLNGYDKPSTAYMFGVWLDKKSEKILYKLNHFKK